MTTLSTQSPFFYFKPQIPPKWTFENVKDIHQKIQPLRDLGNFLETISAIGLLIVAYKAIKALWGTVILTQSIHITHLVCLTLFPLAKALQAIANRHVSGLTPHTLTTLALEKLKVKLLDWPVCKTEEQLKDKLEKDLSFNLRHLQNSLKEINHFPIQNESLLTPPLLHIDLLYHPMKQLQPRLMIQSTSLSMQQKLQLLEIAYQKNIILEFSHYSTKLESFYANLTSQQNKTKALENSSNKQNMQQAFECAVHFLHAKFEKKDVNVTLLNQQLFALGFQVKSKRLLPAIYLEDENTVVIRGNCSEIEHPKWAIKLLAPYVKEIKIETQGLIHTDPNFLIPRKQKKLQKELQTDFPNIQLTFKDVLDKNKGHQMWQEGSIEEPSFFQTLKDTTEDDERIKKLKEKLTKESLN